MALCFAAASRTLFIGSPGNEQVLTYAVSGVANGNFTPATLISSTTLGQLSGIVVDPSGNVYTCDRKSNQIYQWAPGSSSPSAFGTAFSDSPDQILAVYTPITGT